MTKSQWFFLILTIINFFCAIYGIMRTDTMLWMFNALSGALCLGMLISEGKK